MQTIKKTAMLQDKITEIFIKADDFCNEFKNEFPSLIQKRFHLIKKHGIDLHHFVILKYNKPT